MNDKDQAAIDHVASVSKHPHAAMIITGWDVKLEGKITNNPYWHKGYKYELIEPKPELSVMDIMMSNKPTIYDALVERLAREYVLTKRTKWPTPLVERIAAIDLEAAQWIVDHWDDLLESKYASEVSVGRESNELHSMFSWKSSDQGKPYWQEIANKLGEQ